MRFQCRKGGARNSVNIPKNRKMKSKGLGVHYTAEWIKRRNI